MELLDKKQFHIPRGIYLLNHSVGCLPKKAKSKVNDNYFKPWATSGGDAWEAWLASIQQYNQALANLFSADVGDFCPQVNVSSALSKIIASLPDRQNRTEILLTEQDFPSTAFVLSNYFSESKNINFISQDEILYDINVWQKRITSKIDIIFISHVTSDRGQCLPVNEIIELAKKHNIITIVDVAQSAGIIPINLSDWNADFAIGSCVKWLCGGPGAGFLWVNPNIVNQCKPRDTGWFSHENPFEFDIHHYLPATGANRFWGGTPSILPYVIATESISLITSIGIDNIRCANNCLIDVIHQFSNKLDIKIISPVDMRHRGGTVVLKLPDSDESASVLKANKIYFDIRQRNLFRFSPAIYHSKADIVRFGKILAKI